MMAKAVFANATWKRIKMENEKLQTEDVKGKLKANPIISIINTKVWMFVTPSHGTKNRFVWEWTQVAFTLD